MSCQGAPTVWNIAFAFHRTPDGIRTRATGVKVQRAGPLHYGGMFASTRVTDRQAVRPAKPKTTFKFTTSINYTIRL